MNVGLLLADHQDVEVILPPILKGRHSVRTDGADRCCARASPTPSSMTAGVNRAMN